MTDSLSIAAQVAGLISLGIQVTESLYQFYSIYKDQDSDISNTVKKLESLLEVFSVLSHALKTETPSAGTNNEVLVENVRLSVTTCEELIQELQEECDKLQKTPPKDLVARTRTAGRRVAYPLRKSTLEKLNENVGEIRYHVSLALEVLQLKKNEHTHDEIAAIKSLLNLVRADQVSSKIRDWLKAPDASVDHNTACVKRHPGTGKWLLKSKLLQDWIRGQNSFLWINGFAGSGKSVLCSTVIQDIFHHRHGDSQVGIAIFYFKFNDESKQDASAMLRAWALQLTSQLGGEHPDLVRLQSSYHGAIPPNNILLEYLRTLMERFHDVYLIVDALDESPPSRARDCVLDNLELIRHWHLSQIHLLLTSRDQIDIRDALKPGRGEELVMKNTEIDKDIADFIAGRFEVDRRLRKNWLPYREKIQMALAERAQGVFRWVECQIMSLYSCPRSEDHLDRLLKSLPSSLDTTYERMLCGIDPEVADDARRILTLLCFASRPLSVSELIEAFAVELEPIPRLNPRRRLEDADDFRTICIGLIEADVNFDANDDFSTGAITTTMRIAHFSVQEYLESDRIHRQNAAMFGLNSSFAHQEFARICLAYLMQSELTEAHLNRKIRDEYSFADYAARSWPYHYQETKTLSIALQNAALTLLDSEEKAFETWAEFNDPRNEEERLPSPIYYAAELGLNEILLKMIDSGADVNVQGGRFGNPLQAACYSGHKEVVRILFDNGADVNAPGGRFGNALQAACYSGHKEVIRMLFDNGADANAQGGRFGNALQAACYSGHKEVVRMLFDNGADANAQGGEYGNALQAASYYGHREVVQTLLDNGADVNAQGCEYGLEAAEHLAALLSEDTTLHPIYQDATTKFGRERFHNYHDQLLKTFFKDLRSDAQNSVQLATVRSLCSQNLQYQITILIYHKFKPVNLYQQLAMTRLEDKNLDPKQLLDDYLREGTSTLRADLESRLDIHLVQNSISPLDQDDELQDKEFESSSSGDDNDWLLRQNEKETYTYLEPFELFITRSNAFTRLKINFGYLLRPPANLSEALKSRDLQILEHFLTKNFTSAATDDYEWLHELDESGYSMCEIAELLLEDISDSPWIHFTPQLRARHPLQTGFHIPGCAHQPEFNSKPQQLLISEQAHYPSATRYTDILRHVQELCGIGGVVPSTADMSTWHGSVSFDEQSSISMITYATAAAAPAIVRSSRNDLMTKLSQIFANFCAAAAAVQSSGLCCDSFTVLVRVQNCLELRRIEFQHAMKMETYLNLAIQNYKAEAVMQLCVQRAEYILQELKVEIPETTPDADLHYCALAAQFLCTAFLSYIQAHIGPIDFFFLDTPQRKMVLLGDQGLPGDFVITAELIELTCLAEMTQQHVLAFSSKGSNRGLHPTSETFRHDVLTNAEDLLDTWGPGYFVHNPKNPRKIHAVAIGGGFVSLISGENSPFHWAKGPLSESASRTTFEPSTLMRIGAAVSINKNCFIDEAAYRESSFCALEPLGTHEVCWEAQERQAGLQSGQYVIGSYSQTWRKIPGTTLKERSLQQPDWHLIYFLEQSWGMQVSFCTSVARRVSLRELVTDLFPMFTNPLEPDAWGELVNTYNIIQAFTQGDLVAWLLTLSLSLQRYVLSLIRTILEQLQYTGLDDRNNNLVIAWPREGDIGRGLKVPCKAQTLWARVIADAEDCATFAYVTPKCLETDHIKCQGSLRAWQNASKMLVTEMSPSRPDGQPIANHNVTTTVPPAPITTAAMVTTQWELQHRKTYYIKKLNTLLRVKVERPSSATKDVAHLVVAKTNVPQGFWRRLLLREEDRKNHRIRERQSSGDCAESVVVRAELIAS